ncbi:MAG: L-seryl-tRNA(Sec) selenium transferase [Dehalococcoidia bacterium]|jgi:L-seryl-tRNA(Ser) seleniumtransferase
MKNELRKVPSTQRLISEKKIEQLTSIYPRSLILELIHRRLDNVRSSIIGGKQCPSLDEITESVCSDVHLALRSSLRPVINATGVILQTNLGRAPLSRDAIAAMGNIAQGYSNLEFELGTATRGSRHSHVEQLLQLLTGAEAALVVNNNASAIFLVLTALAKKKETIISRSQSVEIGDGFRIPDIMRQSGTKLIEVGTTNCTYLTDYENAITARTAALMRVHPSNFRITGFTNSVELVDMVSLARKHDLPVFDDMGSGCFLDTSQFGLEPEQTVAQSVTAGAAITLFSGDKLLGGPQAGIIIGQKQYIDKLKKHPLTRATRIDKIRLAGLIATLIHYLKGEAVRKIPIWQMIATPIDDIEKRVKVWSRPLGGLAQIVDGDTMIGGGSLPGIKLPTKLLAIGKVRKNENPHIARDFGIKLRCRDIPILGRIADDTLLLDPRTVLPEEDKLIVEALESITGSAR